MSVQIQGMRLEQPESEHGPESSQPKGPTYSARNKLDTKYFQRAFEEWISGNPALRLRMKVSDLSIHDLSAILRSAQALKDADLAIQRAANATPEQMEAH